MEGPLQDMLERIDKKLDAINTQINDLLKQVRATKPTNRWAAFTNDELQRLDNHLEASPFEAELWIELSSRYSAITPRTTEPTYCEVCEPWRQKYNVAISNGLIGTARAFSRQIENHQRATHRQGNAAKLTAMVTNVIENNKFIVTGYFLGHVPNLGFLVGQVMKQAKDFATPAEAQAELHRQLDKY